MSAANLSEQQNQMLGEFKEMFDFTDNEAAIAKLESANWSMERAVESHFEAESSSASRQLRQRAGANEEVEVADGADENVGDDNVVGLDGDENEEEEVEEEEEEEEEEQLQNIRNGHLVSLLPKRYSTCTDALTKLQDIFHTRHNVAPPFFIGEMHNAIQVAFVQANHEERRPIVFYLNHQSSVAANIFASTVITEPSIDTLLRRKFILFPWDCTLVEDTQFILEKMGNCGMGPVSSAVQRASRQGPSAFPVLMVVTRRGSTFKVVQEISCNDEIEEIVEKLETSHIEYARETIREEAARRERQERQKLRDEQESEYQKSLAVDLAKLEKKRRIEEEQRNAELQRAQEEADAKKAEEEEAVRREQVAATLPEEPPATEIGVIIVRFRFPENGQAMRRFRKSDKIRTLVDFLSSKGFEQSKFKYLNSDFPKKNVLEQFNLEASFEDGNWPAREQIFVEEIL